VSGQIVARQNVAGQNVADKMSPGQNVAGQNVARTKCRQDKMSPDKMSPRKNVTAEKMVVLVLYGWRLNWDRYREKVCFRKKPSNKYKLIFFQNKKSHEDIHKVQKRGNHMTDKVQSQDINVDVKQKLYNIPICKVSDHCTESLINLLILLPFLRRW